MADLRKLIASMDKINEDEKAAKTKQAKKKPIVEGSMLKALNMLAKGDAPKNKLAEEFKQFKQFTEANDWNGPLYDPALQKGKPTKKQIAADKESNKYRKAQKNHNRTDPKAKNLGEGWPEPEQFDMAKKLRTKTVHPAYRNTPPVDKKNICPSCFSADVMHLSDGGRLCHDCGREWEPRTERHPIEELAVPYQTYPRLSLWMGVAKASGFSIAKEGSLYIATNNTGEKVGQFDAGTGEGFMAGSSNNTAPRKVGEATKPGLGNSKVIKRTARDLTNPPVAQQNRAKLDKRRDDKWMSTQLAKNEGVTDANTTLIVVNLNRPGYIVKRILGASFDDAKERGIAWIHQQSDPDKYALEFNDDRDRIIYPQVSETIVKTGGQYELKSHTGKNLGKYPSKAGAEKREKQVNYFKHKNESVAEGFSDVVKSVKVGNFRHDLVDTGFGWQVRIYNGDELYDTGLSKNSKQKGLAALDDAVAYTKKQLNIKEQGVAEGTTKITDQQVKAAYAKRHEAFATNAPNKYELADYASMLALKYEQQQSMERNRHGFDPITGSSIRTEGASSGEPDTDQILYYLTKAYQRLKQNRDAYEDFDSIAYVYDDVRYHLRYADFNGFKKAYEQRLRYTPDAAVELFDAMFVEAGLPEEQGTIEQFLEKCSGVTEGMMEGGLSDLMSQDPDAPKFNVSDEEDKKDRDFFKRAFATKSKFGIFQRGGNVGTKHDKPVSVFDSKEEALAKCLRLNKMLSPGEKQYYGIKYVVRDVTGQVDEATPGTTAPQAPNANAPTPATPTPNITMPGQQAQPGQAPQMATPEQMKQQAALIQKNLGTLKTAGGQPGIDAMKTGTTLAKAGDNMQLNPADKDTMTKLAPMLGNVLKDPNATSQLASIAKKASAGVQK